jgi:HEAT repeat protein
MPDILETWVGRLRDADVGKRREAIRQLEAIGDPAALGPLAALFALDPDLETRRLAQWAGKSIYQTVALREANAVTASEEERQRAADILEKAQRKKPAR